MVDLMENTQLMFPPGGSREEVAVPDQHFSHGFVDCERFLISQQIFEKEEFQQFSVSIDDLLTPSEVMEIEESLREIAQGNAQTFKNVEELLEELKR